ncbi:MAG: exosortase-associated EpsI family protein [Verrucomicrobia bacterium]|nr:exosortase-associated EpsI family protein [Verrucomicrobiota bacterium]
MSGNKAKLGLLVAMACILASGVAAGLRRPVAAVRKVDLARALPAALPGWATRELPLGETETVVEAVRGILNFDSYVYREFKRGAQVFTFYGAYWSAGLMPAQSVASHSPDNCWVLAGWTCLEWRSRAALRGAAAGLGPVEERRFGSPGGEVVHVWYWHLQNGRSSAYGFRGDLLRYASRWLQDGFRQIFTGPPEQFFLRISSPRPLEELAGDPGLEQLLGTLSDLVVSAPAGPAS